MLNTLRALFVNIYSRKLLFFGVLILLLSSLSFLNFKKFKLPFLLSVVVGASLIIINFFRSTSTNLSNSNRVLNSNSSKNQLSAYKMVNGKLTKYTVNTVTGNLNKESFSNILYS